MDEIFIEEKKYISSKRAANMTGYAKDYIGQLCREGRVPARLVGRSWYVLETAIQDHRFGNQKTEQEKQETASVLASPSVWEAPRYEASSVEVLPSINRLRDTEISESPDAEVESPEKDEISEHVQDSWRTWFNHIENTDTSGSIVDTELVAPIVIPLKPEKDEEKPEIGQEQDKDINVPIHAVYEPLPKELLPHVHLAVQPPSDEEEAQIQKERKGDGGMTRVIQISAVLLAAVMALAAALGSGYLDSYILSSSQARIIAGIGIYNK